MEVTISFGFSQVNSLARAKRTDSFPCEGGTAMAEELVGAPDAATRLGLTSERIRQLAKAGELPAPAGRIGRQDVWRWQELLDWAVAQGRLDASAGGQRQRVRAWAPGIGQRRRVVDEVMDWDDGRSHAHVRIWEAAHDATEPAIVVLGNLEDSRGLSATNGIEDVAMLVAARHLGPSGLQAQYYDHWSRSAGDSPSFKHVTFTIASADSGRTGRGRGVDRATAQALGGVLVDPSWRATTTQEIQRLVGETVEVYNAGTYTAAMVRAVQHAGEDGEDGVDAVWDPDDALTAAGAYQWLSGASGDRPPGPLTGVRKAALLLLALQAVHGVEEAAADLAWQDPEAPVRLHLPALPRAAELRRVAEGARRAVSHEDAWAVVSAARERLADSDAEERRVLVSARGGGFARLAWWESAIAEPRDDRQGMCGPIVTEADLITERLADHEATEPVLLRALERAALRFLEHECRALEQWDVPTVRPAGPFPATAPTARRYLDAVVWRPCDAGDEHREQRLIRLFDTVAGRHRRNRRSEPKTGFDAAGRMVVISADGRRFSLEWPVGAGRDLVEQRDGLVDAIVKADVDRGGGAQPVWVELADGAIIPLPSHAGWSPAHDYTWGYSGTGPANLAAAISGLVLLALDDPERLDLDDLSAAVHDKVRSGRTPAWPVHGLLQAARAVPS